MNNSGVDDSLMNDMVDEDMEAREKPKVSYVCGGKSLLFKANI
jgi:hypothetical protein